MAKLEARFTPGNGCNGTTHVGIYEDGKCVEWCEVCCPYGEEDARAEMFVQAFELGRDHMLRIMKKKKRGKK